MPLSKFESLKEARLHISKVSEQVMPFHRLKKTRHEYKQENKERVLIHAFQQYRRLIKKMTLLTEADRKLSITANASRGSKGVVDFLNQLHEKDVTNLVGKIDSLTEHRAFTYQKALSELQRMMLIGQKLASTKSKPTDGDPLWDSAIWGFTQIGPQHTETQLHFLVCHVMERFLTQIYRAEHLEIANHKDYFITAMTDMLTLQHIKYGHFEKLFKISHKPKSEGGLGWISDGRVAAYIDNLDLKTSHQE